MNRLVRSVTVPLRDKGHSESPLKVASLDVRIGGRRVLTQVLPSVLNTVVVVKRVFALIIRGTGGVLFVVKPRVRGKPTT